MANTGNTAAFINAQQYGKKKKMKYKSPVVKKKKKVDNKKFSSFIYIIPYIYH